MKNTKITEVTKTINYKGHTIVQGIDDWGQIITFIEDMEGINEFWSIADAKKHINGLPTRIDMTEIGDHVTR